MIQFRNIAVTGGAGYVGSALVVELLKLGCNIRVLDLLIYGKQVFGELLEDPGLELIEGDIRDPDAVDMLLDGADAAIHLACISNDPSFELDPALGKSINRDSFDLLIDRLENSEVKRFIYASSSSVYGLREELDVTEDAPKTPLTDYSKFKLECEDVLQDWSNPKGIDWVIVRPATVCGYAPRLRLDLTVNILTIHALINKRIRIFGGSQLRPNINIKDMVRVYIRLLEADSAAVRGEVFNTGYQNKSVEEIALTVKEALGDGAVKLEYVPSDDLRSYHINSDKIEENLGFRSEYTIEDAVISIRDAHDKGFIKDGLNNPVYYNIKRMRELSLT